MSAVGYCGDNADVRGSLGFLNGSVRIGENIALWKQPKRIDLTPLNVFTLLVCVDELQKVIYNYQPFLNPSVEMGQNPSTLNNLVSEL